MPLRFGMHYLLIYSRVNILKLFVNIYSGKDSNLGEQRKGLFQKFGNLEIFHKFHNQSLFQKREKGLIQDIYFAKEFILLSSQPFESFVRGNFHDKISYEMSIF